MVPKLVAATRPGDGAARRAAPTGRRVGRRLRQHAGRARRPAAAASRWSSVSYDRRPGRASALRPASPRRAPSPSPTRRCPAPRSPARRCASRCSPSTGSRDRDAARRALGLPADRFVVAVTGGSLGSGALNEAVAALRRRAPRRRPGLAVRHVVGERFLAGARPAATAADGILYQVVGYEDRLALALRRRRPARRPRWGEHGRRGRRHRDSRRSSCRGGRGRGPPDR